VPSGLSITRIVLGPFATNCYIVADETQHALIIDPGEPSNLLVETVNRQGLLVVGVVNTHGHGDHIAGNALLKSKFGCPLMVHRLDASMLTDAHANLSAFIGPDCIESPPADRLLEEGDSVQVGAETFRIIHTPGHSPGGICLLNNGVIFSGDTLFAGSIGRTDFPGSSYEQLIHSIESRLLCLPDDTVVYPGHGPETTIGEERQNNPWLSC